MVYLPLRTSLHILGFVDSTTVRVANGRALVLLRLRIDYIHQCVIVVTYVCDR